MNKVLLVGRIANDIRGFTTPSGVNWCRTSVAVTRRTNSTEPITDFIPLVAWRSTADFMSKYLTKGSLVSIEGSFTTGSYNGQNGVVRTYEVTVETINSLESRQQRERRATDTPNMDNSFNPQRNQTTFSGSSKPTSNYVATDAQVFNIPTSNTNEAKHNFAVFDEDDDLQ
ncbi:single-stranded DNA-binding protein [Mycoplasma zalophidermidis]|uniref:Single-stranded DNA-binding protein n=1 Tax=Mycoplasma zalophidermidis TaxID=398174 RepID=A0ABS6DS88_9MOLU|nr:single-stranded DNA-binding protein [Mycoplasma zalophidermidis]MBU4689722.1 single-stranded DNA-binding protein [Mycoplasma zalophidermidis]MBU4693882.1 single-stranded DNA-binding protein [Mycoplasma zalophidermidis]MCR8966646.1 single-stranded DNA-binding protein [Mycoplasma zalophidermidis]